MNSTLITLVLIFSATATSSHAVWPGLEGKNQRELGVGRQAYHSPPEVASRWTAAARDVTNDFKPGLLASCPPSRLAISFQDCKKNNPFCSLCCQNAAGACYRRCDDRLKSEIIDHEGWAGCTDRCLELQARCGDRC